ncbi:MAG: Clp protease N-terminal domain-containing protein [Mucilaginibacter sp.]
MEKHFSPVGKAVIQTSVRLAAQFKYRAVVPEHLFLAIIDESLTNPADAQIILNVFKQLNVDLFSLIEDVEYFLDSSNVPFVANRIPLSKVTERILKVSCRESIILQSEDIDVKQILLAYLRNGSAFSEDILKSKYNITCQNVQDAIERTN